MDDAVTNHSPKRKKQKGMPPRKVFVFGQSAGITDILLMNAPKYALAGEAFDLFASSPHDADVLLVVGTVNYKMAPVLKRVYEQMCSPKMVVAMGVRPLFEAYNLIESLEEVIPVDYYFSSINPDPVEIHQIMSLLIPYERQQ